MSGSRHTAAGVGAESAMSLNANQLALFDAIQKNDRRTVLTLLLKHKLNPNFEMMGMSALSLAIKKGNAAIVKDLLNNGANPNTGSMITPLSAAIKAGMNMIELLLSTPDIALDQRGQFGITPLMTAGHQGNLVAAKKLIEAGANPKATDQFGGTAADHARNNGHIDVAEYLTKQARISTMPEAPATTTDSFSSMSSSLLAALMPAMQAEASSEPAQRVLESGVAAITAAAHDADTSIVAAGAGTHKVDAETIAAPFMAAAVERVTDSVDREVTAMLTEVGEKLANMLQQLDALRSTRAGATAAGDSAHAP